MSHLFRSGYHSIVDFFVQKAEDSRYCCYQILKYYCLCHSTDYHVYIQNLPALFDEESVEKSYNNNRFLQLSQWVTSHLPSFDRG